MTRLDKYQVLVIDDIGYVKKSDAETQVLFEFIAHRYESGSLTHLRDSSLPKLLIFRCLRFLFRKNPLKSIVIFRFLL
jgi:hypothetical protein